MRFEPKSEDQLKAEFLLPDGEYDFTVTEAEEKQSAKGNDMIALKLTAYTPDGGERALRRLADGRLAQAPRLLRRDRAGRPL